jgi:hypothetical protein
MNNDSKIEKICSDVFSTFNELKYKKYKSFFNRYA